MLSVIDRIRNDLPMQKRMHADYVSYMVAKGSSRDEIWVLSEWQKHFDFPVRSQ